MLRNTKLFFWGGLITTVEGLEVFTVIVNQAPMEVMDAVAYTSFTHVENKIGDISNQLHFVFDHDTFSKESMSKFPLIRNNLEFVLKLDEGVETMRAAYTIFRSIIGDLSTYYNGFALVTVS